MNNIQQVIQKLENKEPGVLVTVIKASRDFTPTVGTRLLVEELNDTAISQLLQEKLLVKIELDTDQMKEIQKKITTACEETLDKGSFLRTRIRWDEDFLELMLEPLQPRPRLIILGCGHVGQALGKLASFIEMSLTVVDDRPDFANPDNFPPDTRVICGHFLHAITELSPGAQDFVVIMTRGHQSDRRCLEELLDKDVAYLGMIGSRRRVKELFKDLIKEGRDPELLERVHSPIGLDIGAETPAEIAVSVIAEIIQEWRQFGKSSMDLKLFKELENAVDKFSHVVMATIVQTWGSTPRKAGSKMVVCPDGTILGTIGGGCSEGEVKTRARMILDGGQAELYQISMTGDVAADEGMVCGGKMEVFIEPISG